MIEITVLGDTYTMRHKLKERDYRWNHKDQVWWKVIGEAILNHEIEALRHQIFHRDFEIILRSVDINREPLREKEMRIKLAAGEDRVGTDFYSAFLLEVSGVQIIANNCSPAPLTRQEKRASKQKSIDDKFF